MQDLEQDRASMQQK
jgi:hypothetical protein